MALYQRGDIIEYIDPNDRFETLIGTITAVLRDSAIATVDQDVYRVVPDGLDLDSEGHEVTNEAIMEVINSTTIVNVPDTQPFEETPFIVPPAVVPEEEPPTRGGWIEGNTPTPETNIDIEPFQPIQALQLGRVTHPTIEWTEEMERMSQLWQATPIILERLGTTTIQQIEPIPPPMPVARRHVTATEIIFPTTSGNVHIPIVESADLTRTGDIRSEDYILDRHRTRFIRIRIGSMILSPVMDAVNGLVFKDEDGARWVNSISHHNVGAWSMIRDESHVCWMRFSELRELEQRGGLKSPKPKKNLKRKYGKMPVVKEEEYYASKDYIA